MGSFPRPPKFTPLRLTWPPTQEDVNRIQDLIKQNSDDFADYIWNNYATLGPGVPPGTPGGGGTFPDSVFKHVRYVSPNGSDTNDGKTPQKPFRYFVTCYNALYAIGGGTIYMEDNTVAVPPGWAPSSTIPATGLQIANDRGTASGNVFDMPLIVVGVGSVQSSGFSMGATARLIGGAGPGSSEQDDPALWIAGAGVFPKAFFNVFFGDNGTNKPVRIGWDYWRDPNWNIVRNNITSATRLDGQTTFTVDPYVFPIKEIVRGSGAITVVFDLNGRPCPMRPGMTVYIDYTNTGNFVPEAMPISTNVSVFAADDGFVIDTIPGDPNFGYFAIDAGVDTVVAGTKVFTFNNWTFPANAVTGTITLSGCANAGNNGTFTITAAAGHTVTCGAAAGLVNETFGAGVKINTVYGFTDASPTGNVNAILCTSDDYITVRSTEPEFPSSTYVVVNFTLGPVTSDIVCTDSGGYGTRSQSVTKANIGDFAAQDRNSHPGERLYFDHIFASPYPNGQNEIDTFVNGPAIDVGNLEFYSFNNLYLAGFNIPQFLENDTIVHDAADNVVAATKTFTFANYFFPSDALQNGTLAITGAANAGNNHSFAITAVNGHSVTVAATTLVNETFGGGVTAVVQYIAHGCRDATRRAALNADSGSGLGMGGGFLQTAFTAQGSMRYACSRQNSNGMPMSNVVQDMPLSGVVADSTVDLVRVSFDSSFLLTDITLADNPTPAYAVRSDGSAANWSAVSVNRYFGGISGPMNVISSEAPAVAAGRQTPNMVAQTGWYGPDRLLAGRHMSAARKGTVFQSGLFSQTLWPDYLSWSKTGGITLTPGIRDPHGGTGAVNVSVAGANQFLQYFFKAIGATHNTGDIYVACVWIRGATLASHPLSLQVNNTGPTSYLDAFADYPRQNGELGEWNLFVCGGKTNGNNGAATSVTTNIVPGDGASFDVFMGTLYFQLATDPRYLSDAELAEFMAHCFPCPVYLPPGIVGTDFGVPIVGHGGLGLDDTLLVGASGGAPASIKWQKLLKADGTTTAMYVPGTDTPRSALEETSGPTVLAVAAIPDSAPAASVIIRPAGSATLVGIDERDFLGTFPFASYTFWVDYATITPATNVFIAPVWTGTGTWNQFPVQYPYRKATVSVNFLTNTGTGTSVDLKLYKNGSSVHTLTVNNGVTGYVTTGPFTLNAVASDLIGLVIDGTHATSIQWQAAITVDLIP